MDDNTKTLNGKESLSAMTAQDSERVATSYTIPVVPRKKCEKVTNVTKDKGGHIRH